MQSLGQLLGRILFGRSFNRILLSILFKSGNQFGDIIGGIIDQAYPEKKVDQRNDRKTKGRPRLKAGRQFGRCQIVLGGQTAQSPSGRKTKNSRMTFQSFLEG